MIEFKFSESDVIKKSLIIFSLIVTNHAAQAAGLGDILQGVSKAKEIASDAKDAVKQVQEQTQEQTQESTNTSPAAPVSVLKRAGMEWLTKYSRSQIQQDFYNPLEIISIPLSKPSDGESTTQYSIPIEGKVVILSYKHEADDSPLLIQRHYDAILAKQGFERVVVCSNGCKNMGGEAAWMGMLDVNKKMATGSFPEEPLLLIAHKANAVAFVAVGKSANAPYVSYIQLVEGAISSRTELDAWLASRK
jgi:hypothetical protein